MTDTGLTGKIGRFGRPLVQWQGLVWEIISTKPAGKPFYPAREVFLFRQPEGYATAWRESLNLPETFEFSETNDR